MMEQPVVINGKFLRAQSTGVHRVATELANGLADLQREGHPSVAGLDLRLWLPKDGMARAEGIALPRRVIDFATGIPWEQLTLPACQGDRLLVNLCNIGPVASRHAITMIHDVQVHLSPQSYRPAFRYWYRMVQPLLARRNHKLLTVSDFSRQQMVRIGLCPESRIAVIHNGVDHIHAVGSDSAVVERLGLERHRYALALSTTQAHKNIGLLLNAFANPQLSDLRLVLFGASGRTDFEAQGLHVPANAVFAGRVSDAELRALMEHALCLAFPSTTEGFGLPPLEAMLLGCPAIVAPCGALPEVCGDAVLYAAADDPLEWVTAIAALADDVAQRANWSQRGRERAALFTWRSAAIALADQIQIVSASAKVKNRSTESRY